MYPLINDVATDLDDPPKFVKAEIGPLPEKFKPIISEHYSDLKPEIFPQKDTNTVFAEALEIARKQPRWTVTYENAFEGIVEGYAVTAVFRFRDDFVVRIKAQEGGGSIVDMRSKSRIGKGDFGANAQRIRHYLEELRNAL